MTITIFLADDHAVLRDGMRLLLKLQPDIKVVGDAADGQEAVHQVAKLQPDVVLLDIVMPKLNGIEAARQIAQNSPTTQVIILSMNSNSEHIFQALQAGVRGYLLKASAGSEVVEAIRQVHAGHRYLSQDISEQVITAYIRQREANETKNPLTHLKPREIEILQLVAEGQTNVEIAVTMGLSSDTVKTYRKRIMKKLDLNDLPSLVKFAILNGLTSLK